MQSAGSRISDPAGKDRLDAVDGDCANPIGPTCRIAGGGEELGYVGAGVSQSGLSSLSRRRTVQFSVRPWFIRRSARRTSLAAASRREVKNWLAAAPIFYFPQLLSLDELLDESESRERGLR